MKKYVKWLETVIFKIFYSNRDISHKQRFDRGRGGKEYPSVDFISQGKTDSF